MILLNSMSSYNKFWIYIYAILCQTLIWIFLSQNDEIKQNIYIPLKSADRLTGWLITAWPVQLVAAGRSAWARNTRKHRGVRGCLFYPYTFFFIVIVTLERVFLTQLSTKNVKNSCNIHYLHIFVFLYPGEWILILQ